MPKSCNECKFDLRTDICQAFCEWNAEHPYSIRATDRLPDCPLSEVPELCEDAVSRNLVLSEVKSGLIRTIDGENWKRVSENVQGIRNLPSAQPEIVRCKDCRYAHLTRDGKCKYCDTWTDVDGYPSELYVDGEFYCGYAERRTDERTDQ